MDVLNRLLQHGPHASSFFRLNSAVAHVSLHAQVRVLYLTERADGSNTSKPLPMHPEI